MTNEMNEAMQQIEARSEAFKKGIERKAKLRAEGERTIRVRRQVTVMCVAIGVATLALWPVTYLKAPAWVVVGIAVCITAALVVVFWMAVQAMTRTLRAHRSLMESPVPQFARIHMVNILCPACGQPIHHDEMVFWSERLNGERTDMAHAPCVVLVRRADGTVTRVDGRAPEASELKPEWNVLLSEQEWDKMASGVAVATASSQTRH
jgi:hypothetical protein